ncbi:hypothetical protein ACFQX7_39290 [Luedemannella flava]
MIVEVDPASAVPPYEQIRAQLATMISTGTLPVGAQLPLSGNSPPTWGSPRTRSPGPTGSWSRRAW